MTETRPLVVMMVGQDIATDTRVRKVALSVSRLPVKVALVCYTADDRPSWTRLGEVDVWRVPVPFITRQRLDKQRKARRKPKTLPGTFPGSSRIRRVLSGAQRRAWRTWDERSSQVTVGARWRKLTPEALDYAAAFGPVIDHLKPDFIHAHDVQMTYVAAEAVARAKANGRTVTWLYDAHEWVAGLSQYGRRRGRVVAAMADLEREFIGGAARVITVSDPLAEALRDRYSLERTPDVVLNIPADYPPADPDAPTVRQTVGVAADVPLLVYSGAVQHARGVHTAIEALVELTGVHLAVVCVPSSHTAAVDSLREVAATAGVANRVHFLDPVGAHDVTAFLRDADLGLIPLRHFPSHEMALTNKLFEYLRAGLPVVVSDCEAQRRFVEDTGVGVVHRADDAPALAAAVRDALARSVELRDRIVSSRVNERYTWAAQESVLHRVYRELLPSIGNEVAPAAPSEPKEVLPRLRAAQPQSVLLGIGPLNTAGQGWRWAESVRAHVPGASAWVLARRNDKLDFPADEQVDSGTFAHDRDWQADLMQRSLGTWTHALIESGRPLFGVALGSDFVSDAALLAANDVKVGLVFHGSDIRNPARHAASNRWSPFRDPDDALTARLQTNRDRMAQLVAEFDGPVFVTTPDLLADLPQATLLPLSVDTALWRSDAAPRLDGRPVVLHAPSNAALKGTAAVDPLLRQLDAEGLIEYVRPEAVPPEEMPALVRGADIVIDQFAIGIYSLAAVEAMAAGRLVIAHVTDEVRAAMGGDVPILEANPDDLEQVLRAALADPQNTATLAARGPEFVSEQHDGRATARVLSLFLDSPLASG